MENYECPNCGTSVVVIEGASLVGHPCKKNLDKRHRPKMTMFVRQSKIKPIVPKPEDGVESGPYGDIWTDDDGYVYLEAEANKIEVFCNADALHDRLGV